MTDLHERTIDCPYCGEPLEVLLNEEEAGQEYIEDCQVCCKPIVFSVFITFNGDLDVSVRDENDTL